jgi:hypothetical protein
MLFKQNISGYREQYDPEPALLRLVSDHEAAIDELWENLYHQEDVDTASYYSVPALVEAGELSLVAAIEVARHEPQNPPIPKALKKSYDAALLGALELSPVTEEECRSFYIIHAASRGNMKLAKAMDLMGVSEILDTYD